MVALQALTEYIQRAQQNEIDMTCDVTSTVQPGFRHHWQARPENAFVLQIAEVRDYPHGKKIPFKGCNFY